VRVRVRLDDLFSDRNHPLLTDLSAHPQVEVRLFNPFSCLRQSGVLLADGSAKSSTTAGSP